MLFVLTSFASDASVILRRGAQPRVIDAVESWISILIIRDLRADLSHTHALDLV